MLKIIRSLILTRAEKGNLITSIGSLIALISLSLPLLLKGRGSFVSSFEYLYTFIISGEGNYLMTGSIFIAAISSLAALISGPSRIITYISIISALLFAFALSMILVPISNIGFGTYLMLSGLLISAAGILRR
jgi:hypothetical protein